VSIEIMEYARRFCMAAEALPDHAQRALPMAAELLDEGKDFVARMVGRRDGTAPSASAQGRR